MNRQLSEAKIYLNDCIVSQPLPPVPLALPTKPEDEDSGGSGGSGGALMFGKHRVVEESVELSPLSWMTVSRRAFKAT